MVDALYFDGRSARARAVRLVIEGGALVATPREVAGEAGIEPAGEPNREPDRQPVGEAAWRWPLSQVRWPERTRHGRRVVHLADGGQLDIADAAAFDAWCRAHGIGQGWVVRAQQHWRATLVALVLLLAVLAGGYRWGVPWLADGVVALVPHEVDQAVGQAAFDSLREAWLSPSRLPPQRQQALRALATAALDATVPRPEQRPWTLRFHAGGPALGANAFALPDGSIVLTDEMVALLEGHDDALVGVFGHEYGHVHRRHGMRALARFTLVSTATSVALGDFSAVLAGVPAVLAQLGYSRDAEREADEDAARLLVASGRDPAVMAVLFERLARRPGGGTKLPIALASHPLDDERIRFFRDYRRDGARR